MKLTKRDSRLLLTIQPLLWSTGQWDCLTGSRLNQDNPKPWTSTYQVTVTTHICLISHQFLPSSTSEVSFTYSFNFLFRDQIWYFVWPGPNAKGWLHPESSWPRNPKHHRREQHTECSWACEAVSTSIFWPSSIGKGSSRWIYRSHATTRCITSLRRTISEKWTRLWFAESTRQASSITGYSPGRRSPWLTRQPISSDRTSPRRPQSQRFGKTSLYLFRTKSRRGALKSQRRHQSVGRKRRNSGTISSTGSTGSRTRHANNPRTKLIMELPNPLWLSSGSLAKN